jgi:hypothetical protein
MTLHRLGSLLSAPRPISLSQSALVACPVVLVYAQPAQQNGLRELYRMALEQAEFVHRPSRWAPLYRPAAN